MGKTMKTKVFMSGRSQAVRIPVGFRLKTDEVYIRRDEQSGDLILSQTPGDWETIYAAVDAARFPDDFLADRRQKPPQQRADL